MNERDLVFIGGGHTHALALRMLAMNPIQNVRLTLITDTLMTPYSGMLPGYIAGHYSLEETHIDLNRLCTALNVRLIHARARGIDLAKKEVHLVDQPPIAYDIVSINTGSTPNLQIPGAAEFAVGVKPVSQLTHTWRTLLKQDYHGATPHWTVVGAGAAGIEVVLSIAHRFTQENKPIRLSLIQSGHQLLPAYSSSIQKRVKQKLDHFGIELVTEFKVAEVKRHQLIAEDGRQLPIDQSLWCTPATAPTWPEKCGLSVDPEGFIAVNEYLQSTSHSDVFATGDVASMAHSPRPKAGVYAVRSAPFLVHNLRAALKGQSMKPARLQTDFLSLISLGDKTAVGQRNGISLFGSWVWRWKDTIDRKFMRLFDDRLPTMTSMPTEPMHCAGCGSKLGPELLSESLNELTIFQRSELSVDLSQAEDAALALSLNEHRVYQSLDGFRSFTNDDYRLGKVATHHAINDLYAMGMSPTSAQVWVNLAFNHPRLLKRDFNRVMAGVTEALYEHETTLIGGHSTEGVETHVALVVNGVQNQLWPKSGGKAGDWLVLNKSVGSGIILSAIAQNKAPTESIEALWQTLMQSNRAYFEALKALNVHAATDVTGFGLIGHLLEMVHATNLQIQLDSQAVPLIDGALSLSEQGIGSSLLPQLRPLKSRCAVRNVPDALLNCLFDPQTNGGLLIALDPSDAKTLIDNGLGSKIGDIQVSQPNMNEKIVIY